VDRQEDHEASTGQHGKPEEEGVQRGQVCAPREFGEDVLLTLVMAFLRGYAIGTAIAFIIVICFIAVVKILRRL
jgi:hypothetical protein